MWIENHGVRSLSWPAHSPDLNPIENLWCETGQLIAKDKPTKKVSRAPYTVLVLNGIPGSAL